MLRGTGVPNARVYQGRVAQATPARTQRLRSFLITESHVSRFAVRETIKGSGHGKDNALAAVATPAGTRRDRRYLVDIKFATVESAACSAIVPVAA